ncbi:MAG: hypothetical protein MRY83_05475, partial [Flavobacteriales bacterium]|nr:hypothetical protein [Flavobacteriales bacterium]
GKRWGFGPYKIVTNTKTLAGNLACFISAYILCAGIGYMEFREIINPFGAAAIVAFIATVGEGITSRGYDNVVIPLSITGTLLVMRHMVDSGMI